MISSQIYNSKLFIFIFNTKISVLVILLWLLSNTVFPLVHRDYFYQFGEICNLHIVPKQKCVFVTYTTREAAEKAADGSFNKLIVNGMEGVIVRVVGRNH